MKKLYLAHPISTTGEFNDSIRVAERIEKDTMVSFSTKSNGDYFLEQKYQVYAPALNKAINDKSNNPTPKMIYQQDVDNLRSADVVVINYTGGDSDGTVLEMGLLGGLIEGIDLMLDVRNELQHDDYHIRQLQNVIKGGINVELKESDIKIIQLEILSRTLLKYISKLPKIYVYSSNQRALKPQLYNLVVNELYEAGIDKALEGYIPSGKLNAMVLGLVEEHFIWCENEDEVIKKLEEL